MSHLAILGLMGVGKSTTADALAARLALPRRDSDVDLERATGRSGRTIAAVDGIEQLHRLEAEALLDALAEEHPTVISAAASVVEHPACRAALSDRATVVVLHLPSEGLADRIASGGHRRPMDRAEIEAVEARRMPLFAEISDLDLDASVPTPELVEAIVDHLSKRPR